MATNTAKNIGIRVETKSGAHNFETAGTTLYYCNHEPLRFLTTLYHVGNALTFDVGGTHYSAAALKQLELFWNQGWIRPDA